MDRSLNSSTHQLIKEVQDRSLTQKQAYTYHEGAIRSNHLASATAVYGACRAALRYPFEAIFYGSRSRADYDPDSDADLLVLLAGEHQRSVPTKLGMTDLAYDVPLASTYWRSARSGNTSSAHSAAVSAVLRRPQAFDYWVSSFPLWNC